jgi:hypothetical protein
MGDVNKDTCRLFARLLRRRKPPFSTQHCTKKLFHLDPQPSTLNPPPLTLDLQESSRALHSSPFDCALQRDEACTMMVYMYLIDQS